MQEEKIIRQINESKAEQELRDSLVNNSDYNAEDAIHKKVLESYEQMDESQKQQFVKKGWKNG